MCRLRRTWYPATTVSAGQISRLKSSTCVFGRSAFLPFFPFVPHLLYLSFYNCVPDPDMSINKRGLPLHNQTRAMFTFRPVSVGVGGGGPIWTTGPVLQRLSLGSGGIKMCHRTPASARWTNIGLKHDGRVTGDIYFFNFYSRLNNPWLVSCTFLVCRLGIAKKKTKRKRKGNRIQVQVFSDGAKCLFSHKHRTVWPNLPVPAFLWLSL